MALSSALSMASFGILTTQTKISVISQNITNADVAGYTRKTHVSEQFTTNIGTYVTGGVINSALNKYLVRDAIDDMFVLGRTSALTSTATIYGKKIGNIASEYSLADSLDRMHQGLSALAVSPEDTAYKTQVVNDARQMSNYLRNLTETIQEQRFTADKEMSNVVSRVNGALAALQELNEEMAFAGQTTQMDTSNYEDQRYYLLQQIAQDVEINYFTTSDNRIQVYLPGGTPLLMSKVSPLEFTGATSMNELTTYPGTLDGITVNGIDVTSNIRGGKLAGFIEARDDFFVDEQAKLNELSNKLMNQVNAALNMGSSLPPRTSMTGVTANLTAASPFSGAGTFRVAVVNPNGTLVNYQDINIGAMATVGDVVTALNAVPGISATLTAAGELSISATAANTALAINSNNTVTTPDGFNVGQFFGMNNLFKGTGASNIAVADYLNTSADFLASGALSMSATLAVGDAAISPGDGTIAKRVADSLYQSVAFNAAGNFGVQNNSVMNYTQSFMTNAVFRSNAANEDMKTADMLLKNSLSLLDSTQGVNIDEERALLLQLENNYKASASVIQTIQTLFDALIDAIR
ncbi:MAG: hypothetical protein V4621_02920 [Pseudomonadota bacterium]